MNGNNNFSDNSGKNKLRRSLIIISHRVIASIHSDLINSDLFSSSFFNASSAEGVEGTMRQKNEKNHGKYSDFKHF